jgi:hypothetical protein
LQHKTQRSPEGSIFVGTSLFPIFADRNHLITHSPRAGLSPNDSPAVAFLLLAITAGRGMTCHMSINLRHYLATSTVKSIDIGLKCIEHPKIVAHRFKFLAWNHPLQFAAGRHAGLSEFAAFRAAWRHLGPSIPAFLRNGPAKNVINFIALEARRLWLNIEMHEVDAIRETDLIALVESFDSGEINRREFQQRVRALPDHGILAVSRILSEERIFFHAANTDSIWSAARNGWSAPVRALKPGVGLCCADELLWGG